MWTNRSFYAPVFIIVVISISSHHHYVNGFNIDVRGATVHRGTENTFFGFAVTQHRDGDKPWVIIGAPLAHGTQEKIQRGGAVFRCIPNASGSCQHIIFDSSGNHNVKGSNNTELQAEEKAGQWFGATVESSGDSGIILACAPRFVFFSYNRKRRDPVGFCYLSKGGFTSMVPLSPCKNEEKWGYHRLGSCQAGFSASIDPSGHYASLGAVGSYYWQGKVITYDLHKLDGEIYETFEGSQQYDDTYMGYSLTHGNFAGRSGRSDVAVGMPRGANMNGKIVIMTSNMKPIANITGDTMGTYFGYSLTSADLNGDGMDDIIIGAPFYTKPESRDKSYEHGRIYVAYQKYRGVFEIGHRIDGSRQRARFGNSVTRLGDVNKDGFEDIAVGAPYDGENKNGAVYIFNGAKNGINPNYSQAIYASDLNEPGLTTFGWSLSGGLDMDDNGYPDLLVGAYQSDRAVYLRARPIVKLNATLKLNPPKVSLRDQSCLLPDGTRVTCFEAEICMKFDGYKVPSPMNLTTFIRLDYSSNRPSRAFLLIRPGKSEHKISIDLSKNREKCQKFKVYITNNIRDKLRPIKIEVEYTINDFWRGHLDLKPILDHTVGKKLVHNVQILKNCSVDEICVPDLRLTATPNMDLYLIGTGKGIELNVTVSNQREDAFESIFELEIPFEVEYSHTEGIKGCIPPKPKITGKNILRCDIGNPLLAKEKLNFIVHLKPKAFVTAYPTFLFLMSVNSTNPELNHTTSDNSVQISIPVRVEVNLTSSGASNPEQLIHNASEIFLRDQTTIEDFGYLVTHSYTLHNHGPSSIKMAKITILWPTKTLDGRHLMYLLAEPQIDITPGADFQPINVECEKLASDVIDPLRLSGNRDLGYRLYSNFLVDDPNSNSYQMRNNDSLISRKRRASTQVDIDKSFITLEDAMSCGETRCTKIICRVNNFGRQSITFTIKSRLLKNVISSIGLSDFQVSSRLVSEIAELPYGVKNNYIPPKVTLVSTDVRVIGLDRGLLISWWIILLAILVGLILLSLLALCLWKCGFFKRKRPPSREDFEPLQNSNGYRYQKGDTFL